MDSNPTPDTTVANSRPPACDRPRTSNRNRVAHRSDNSVVTFWNHARNQSRVGFQPHHSPVHILPAQNRVTHRISIYLSTRAGNLPRGRTSTQVGLGHEPLKRPFRSTAITERVLSPTSPDPILITGCLKPNELFHDARWHFQWGKDPTNRNISTSTFISYTRIQARQ